MRLWGPVDAGSGTWRFNLWAPAQRSPRLEVEGQEPLSLIAGEGGWFHADAPARPGIRYRFRLDDGLAVPDPASRAQSGGVHGWSVVTDPREHVWQATGWRGRPWEEAIIQEVHVGLCGGFRGLADELPRLAEIGVTAVELMPVGAFGGTRGWGYDGVLPFVPSESYGTPGDLRALIDRAHGLGLMVLLDVVYNHFGPDGNYLGVYAPDFFDADVHTPWGGAVAVGQPPVAAYFRENALMWLEDYRFDGLRFDAVHAIGDDGFLDWLAGQIRRHVPGRHIHLILENEHNDAARLAPGLYDAQWNDDFHNVLHVLLTDETSAYYRDFADDPAERLARCLAEGFIYQGEPSPNQDGRPRGGPSGHLPPTAFVSFLQNHDQVGNRALGERLTLLADPARLRAATALLLLSPQIPLLFMGDERGSQSPFLFFTDFHDELADAVREGRRREFAKFDAFRDEAARARIPDPNAGDTFAASRAQPGPDAEEWEAFYRHLIGLRTRLIVPRLRGAVALGAAVLGAKAVSAAWTLGDGAVLTVAINLGRDAVSFPADTGEPIFARGEAGAPASFAAWLTSA
ncbi:MAG: malto-oligosyltrehalose trehalohydrolase [Sphingobium sp.]